MAWRNLTAYSLQLLQRRAIGLAEIGIVRFVGRAILQDIAKMPFGVVGPALQQRVFAEIERSLAALLALHRGIFIDRLVGQILRPDPPDEQRNGGSGPGLGIEPRRIAGELILVILPGPRPRQMQP